MPLDDESELLRTHPHFLSYFGRYALWGWFAVVGIVGLSAGPTVAGALQGMSGTIPATNVAWASLDAGTAWFVVWAIGALVPLGVMPFLRIRYRVLVATLALLAAGVVIQVARTHVHSFATGIIGLGFLQPLWDLTGEPQPDPVHYESALALGVGLIGLIACEFHRGSRVWILTNKRLIGRFGRFNKSERDLLFSQVDDLVIHQTFLGSLLNYGTVIPLAASGLAADAGGADGDATDAGPRRRGQRVNLGDGRHVVIPREPSFYVLWGVPDPRGKKDTILQQLDRAKPAPAPRSGAARVSSRRSAAADTDADD